MKTKTKQPKQPLKGTQKAKVLDALNAGKKVTKKTFKMKLSAVVDNLRKDGHKIPFAVNGVYQLKSK
jgi:hypothetical protein